MGIGGMEKERGKAGYVALDVGAEEERRSDGDVAFS